MMVTITEKTTTLPLIAILRGITPEHILAVADLLIEEGFTHIEVPLNSPSALQSIKMLVDTYGSQYSIGAGTVTNANLAKQVIEIGANLIVTPNFNEEVIQLSVAAKCDCYVGVVTPTEAFNALAAGATALKIFPISMLGIDGFKALKSVLPANTQTFPVGGIEPTIESMSPLVKAGADGFGLGSALYKPSMSYTEIRQQAAAFVSNFIHIQKNS